MLSPDRVDDLDPLAIDAAYPWPADARWVRCNMVATVDGAGRGPEGRSGDINSPADMRLFGMLRGTADAVLVGAATIRAEMYRPSRAKPDYAERRAALGQRPAVVIAIVSRSLDIPFEAPLFTEPVERPILITASSAPIDRLTTAQRVADVVVAGDAEVDLSVALTALAERQLPRVHCEGGPSLLAELAARGLLDELDLSLSPLLAGGSYVHERPPRILDGWPLPDPPRPLRLAHVLEEEGMLFLRYLLQTTGRTGDEP